MLSKRLLLLGLFLFVGCAPSENLNDDEMQYVRTTLAITKARIASHDSVQLVTKLDSVYKKFGTNKEGYQKKTVDFAKIPDRAGIIFRAIADSLNIK